MEILLPDWGLFAFVILALAQLFFWILVIRDLYKGDFINPYERTLWLLIILFAPLLGTLLYLAVGRKQKRNTI